MILFLVLVICKNRLAIYKIVYAFEREWWAVYL